MPIFSIENQLVEKRDYKLLVGEKLVSLSFGVRNSVYFCGHKLKYGKMNNKKLYRSITDKKLCGVCGGLGEYFEVDATLIRLLWVIFTFMGGAGVMAYIICAIIVPQQDQLPEP